MENLVIRLGSHAEEPLHWLVWSSQEQEIIASGELPNINQLDSLQQRVGERPITALISTSDCLLRWVNLPAKAARKASTVVPFMMEEEINGDIQEQFFALGQRKGDLHQVAIVSQEKMTYWIDQIEQAGLFCDKMLPDVLALPKSENGWTALHLGNSLLIRQDDWQGMQGEPSWMTAAINHFTQDQEKPIQISYWGEALTGLNRAEIDFHEVEMPMQLLAKGAVACNFNLLQGSYKPKSRNQGQWKQWRVAAILTVVALSTALIDKSVELSRLTQQKQNLDQQIEAEFKRAFPETTRIVNVRSQMTQKMEALEREGSGVSVLSMMSQLSPAFADSQVKPQNLKFDNKRAEIRFQAVAQSFEALDKFRQLAESSGFEVQQGAINNSGERVIGSISVKS